MTADQLNHFPVPDSVSLKMPVGANQDAYKFPPSIPLGNLDDQTLSDLCDQFRAAIFSLAQIQKERLP